MEGSNVVTNIPPGFSIPPNYISSQENVATKSETTSTTMYTPNAQTYAMSQLNPATIGGSTTTNSVSHMVSNQSVTSTTSSKYL